MAQADGLRLRTRDDEDLRVVAAVLQDALVPLGDMTYQKRQRRFVLVANRFMWEDEPTPEPEPRGESPATPAPEPGAERDASFEEDAPLPRFRRVNCGVRFEPIGGVKLRGIDLRQRDQILNMLTVEPDPEGLTLLFSDGAAIRLLGDQIQCHLEDLGEPWPTDWRPSHPLDGAGQAD